LDLDAGALAHLVRQAQVYEDAAVYDPQTRLYELRLRVRRNPEARAMIDRCLAIVARAYAVEADSDFEALDREVTVIVDDLALRFGAPTGATVQ
jgi:hypothetical protein